MPHALYRQVVHALQRDIARKPVGSRLPTEAELARRFDVSRHTIREALREMRDAGLVSSRQGSGTVVAARESDGRYAHRVSSLADLLQYAKETRFDIQRAHFVTVDGRLAARLGCNPGRRWLCIEGVRRESGDDVPICWLEVYVHRAYSGIRRFVGKRRGAIYGWIEDLYRERIVVVDQTFRAATVPDSVATTLAVASGTAALEIVRVFKNPKHKILEISFSLHPIDRFHYRMQLRADETVPQQLARPAATRVRSARR